MHCVLFHIRLNDYNPIIVPFDKTFSYYFQDNMFAVVGQKLGETENIYETIESYTCEIEKELLHTLNKMQIEPKPRPPVKRINRAAPKPIVIYEEPMSESQQQDDPYVVAIREDPDNTYETIGTVLSSEMDSLPRLPHQDNRPRHVNSELNRKGAVDCGNRPIMRPGLSSNNLDNHDVHDHLLKIRPGNLEVPGQPVSCKGCYQTRMEAVARKVSLLKGRGEFIYFLHNIIYIYSCTQYEGHVSNKTVTI